MSEPRENSPGKESAVNENELEVKRLWEPQSQSQHYLVTVTTKLEIFSFENVSLASACYYKEISTTRQGCRIVESAWQPKFCAWQKA